LSIIDLEGIYTAYEGGSEPVIRDLLPLSQDHQYGMALLSIFRSSNKQINVWVKKIIRATLFSMLTFVY